MLYIVILIPSLHVFVILLGPTVHKLNGSNVQEAVWKYAILAHVGLA